MTLSFIDRWLERLQKSPARPWETLTSESSEYDRHILWVVLVLLLLGTAMVYSASIAIAHLRPSRSLYGMWLNWADGYFLWRHLFFAVGGVMLASYCFRVPLETWQRYAGILFIFTIILMMVIFIPGVGEKRNGAVRWISFFGTTFQPSELMKMCVLLYAADFVVRKQHVMKSLTKGFIPLAVAVGFVGALMLLQPDLGGLVVVVVIAMGILFLGGVNGVWFGGMLVILLGVFSTIIWSSSWRRERIFAYLDPWSADYALNKGYQLTHSLIAYGRGGVSGVGLGNSVEKLQYLPEAHSDFLLAVLAEELGLIGVLAVIAAFAFLVYRAFKIAKEADALGHPFAAFVARGVALWLGVQAIVNVGVTSGALPTKGLTLPFLSYGGSSLVMSIFAIMLLLRADYEVRKKMRPGIKTAKVVKTMYAPPTTTIKPDVRLNSFTKNHRTIPLENTAVNRKKNYRTDFNSGFNHRSEED